MKITENSRDMIKDISDTLILNCETGPDRYHFLSAVIVISAVC